MKIIFDMDGTIADLYGVESWLDYIHEEDTCPYREAEPMVEVDRLVEVLAECKKLGYEIEVVSWLAMGGSRSYDMRVRSAKIAWIKRYFGDTFTAVHIIKYGVDKSKYCEGFSDILFDDNEEIRANWLGEAHTPDEIFDVLESLVR